MKYRHLGDAGIQLSEIGLGGWLTFGNAVELEQTKTVMGKAFDLGINFFDTANAYAQGKCEEVWGGVLADHKRSDYVLATKVFFPMGKGPNDRGLSRKHITEQCHASLRRLRTDYLDLYQCHRWDDQTPVEETVRVMDDLIRQGKVLYWGFSEWSAPQIEACLQTCGHTYYRPKGSQPQYNLVNRKIEKEVLPLCEKAGIGQVVFSPLAQGILTGKYKPGTPFPADSRANDNRQNQYMKQLIGDQDLLAKVQRLIPIAQEQQCTLAQLSLAWILRQKGVTACIVGATKPKQLEDNADASGVELDAPTLARIDEIMA
jgi:voltage-dependent potassium channel beta subunit